MARVSTYLNFARSAEAAFRFYKSIFGGEFAGPIHRFGEMPAQPGQPPLAEADRNLVMHVELPILGGHVLMGTDAPESMGFNVVQGNNVYINLEPDTRAETDRLFQALSADAKMVTNASASAICCPAANASAKTSGSSAARTVASAASARERIGPAIA